MNQDLHELKESLLQFQQAVNSHPRIPTLIKDWNRDLFVEAHSAEKPFYLKVQDQKINLIEEKDQYPEEAHIHLRADYPMLVSIFKGEKGPVEAYFDGDLECYASEADQAKLDALTMVIWSV